MAEIDTLASLKTNWAAGGTHTIVANTDGGGPTYVLDADITAGADLVLTASGGAITIDGNDSFNLIVDGTDFTLNGIDASNHLIITQGSPSSLEILASSAGVTGVLNYCTISEALTNDGVDITGALAGNVDVTLNNCTVANNRSDGVSIHSDAVGVGFTATVTTNNCTLSGHTGIATSDALTAHRENQTIVVNNCTMSDNNQGISLVGDDGGVNAGPVLRVNGLSITNGIVGIRCISDNIWDVELHDVNIFALGDANGVGIKMEGEGKFSIDRSRITGDATADFGIQMVPDGTAYDVQINNCIIEDFADGVGVDSGGVMDSLKLFNCTLNNNARALYADGTFFNASNCIFSNNSIAWDSEGGSHYLASDSSNNCFYDNTADTSPVETLPATDVQADPDFVDTTDFELEFASPCRRAGVYVGGGIDYNKRTWPNPPDIGANRAPGAYSRPTFYRTVIRGK